MKRRVWKLVNRPEGINFDDALSLIEEEIDSPKDNKILIKTKIISMDAGTRMWMSDREDSYQPPLELGSNMVGVCLAEILESDNPNFSKGDLVRGFGEWADYAVVEADSFLKLETGLDQEEAYLSVLGLNGWTAYVGVMEVGKPKEGETFLVSAAAGATGSLAGQIAKKAGCKVVGLAGSQEKCDWLVNDLGFDSAINYKTEDLDAALKDVCPNGIDIYFDNVAGDILNVVLQNLALYARIPLCGLIAQYNEKGSRMPGPDNFDQLLMKRASITGFFCPDFLEDGPKIEKIMHDWYIEGSLKFKADVTNGLENVLVSYKRMFNGDNIGKTLVKL
ncbi:MAG: NADP-dependent oxidoreductase [Pseudomonadota bacterium]|nr:NADP-dependent oxidoreductase [Pseudomonadota bacterium]